MNPGASMGRMPANVSVRVRASVTSSACDMIFAYANIKTSKKRTSVATLADPDSLPASCVATKLGHVGEAGLEALEQLRMKGVARLRDRVVLPGLFLPDANEARSSQIRQVPGCCRLRHPKDRDQVAHAEFALLQQMQDAQSRTV